MSLLNIVLLKDRAKVYVDTAAGGLTPKGDAMAIEMAKVLPFIVPNCVLAGRGNPAFLAMLFVALSINGSAGFDAMFTALPSLASQVHQQYTSTANGLVPGVAATDQELALIGWSEARQRMACVMCFFDTGEPAPELIELYPGDEWVTPWLDSWGPEPTLAAGDTGALDLGREQALRGAAQWPGSHFGGRLLAVELTRDTLGVVELGAL